MKYIKQYNVFENNMTKIDIIDMIKSFVLYTTYDSISLEEIGLDIIYDNNPLTEIISLSIDEIEYCKCNKFDKYYSGEYEKIRANGLKLILDKLIELSQISFNNTSINYKYNLITKRYATKIYNTEKEYNHFYNFLKFLNKHISSNHELNNLMKKFPGDFKKHKANKFNI